MDDLAVLHAAWWNRVGELAWLPALSDARLRRSFQSDFDAGWRAHRTELDALVPGFTPLGDALVGRLADTLAPLAGPPTLLHGDAHAENLPLADERVVFLDWQAPRLGNAGFDVAVFTAMSYPVNERRRVERALVDRHAAAIRQRDIDWPDPWEDYRRGLLRRAARIVEITAAGPIASLAFVFERCATAAVDHAVGDLIV